MDSFALGYLIRRFVFRGIDALHHWYVDGPRWFLRTFFAVLADLDRSFAVRITLRHFSEPLYQDYSIVGRVLGIVLRSLRAGLGGVIYAALGIVWGAACLAWLCIPVALLVLFFVS